MTNARTDDRHIVAVVLGGRSGGSRDQIMTALVRQNLPRAYAGVRQAPVVAEAAAAPRPTLVADAAAGAPLPLQRSALASVDTTAATAPARGRSTSTPCGRWSPPPPARHRDPLAARCASRRTG